MTASYLTFERSGVKKNSFFRLVSNAKSFLKDRKSRYHNGTNVLQVRLNRNLLETVWHVKTQTNIFYALIDS